MHMDEWIRPIVIAAGQSKWFQVLIVLVVMDVIFGCLRAIREKSFNSTIGINGMIRKAGMLISLVCMVYLDMIVEINLIGFLPEKIRSVLPAESIGIMEFFALLYVIYEVVSVLKNMALSGLPVEKIWEAIKRFLQNNTSEIAVLPEDIKETSDAIRKDDRFEDDGK
ncbi:MAG: phage holin family protein [Blautia sp.]|nr:phage holin family protein [Blautia sp.]